MGDIQLEQAVLEKLHPAYIRTDWDGHVLDVGPSLRRLIPAMGPGSEIDRYFQIFCRGQGDLRQLGQRGGSIRLKSHDGAVVLFGMSVVQDWGLAFLVSHAPETLHAAERSGLRLSDFSQGDASLTRLVASGVLDALLQETREAVRSITAAHEASVKVARLQKEFIANVSHELRTPLAGVIGYIDLLAEMPLPLAAQRSVERIAVAAGALESVISDVLDYSQMEAGSVRIRPIATRIDQLVAEVVGLMRPRADAKLLALSFDVSDVSGQLVEVDGNRIAQVLLNLVDNGIKFTAAGAIHVSAAYTAGALEIVVSDTGSGIKPTDVPNLFRRFYRLDNSATCLAGGTGLGLAISKGLIDLMGGSIVVQSQVGEGTTFRISVPAELTAARAPILPVGSMRGLVASILVADDTPTNLELLVKIIDSPGWTITRASNGVQVARLCREHDYDLVVMDVHMPGLDGVAATQVIRADCPRNCRTPVILLSADGASETMARALDAGADRCLSKPFRAADLRRAVEACLVQNADRGRHS
jgi:signal transduction histidine kinase/ActR/RegA family two-component response regulator